MSDSTDLRWTTTNIGSVVTVRDDFVAQILARDPAPAGWPLHIGVDVSALTDGTGIRSATAVVTAVLKELHEVAIGLFPSWLPTAQPDGHSDLDVAAARTLAIQWCKNAVDYAPYLSELAATAVRGGRWDVTTGLTPATQILGVARVLARAYDRDDVVLVLRSTRQPEPTAVEQAAIADGASWLAEHGRIAVWLSTSAVPDVDRFPTRPGLDHDPTPARPSSNVYDTPVVSIAPRAGMPAPNSPAEQALERALRRADWGAERCWNTLFSNDSPLIPPMRIDLLWRAARIAVEIDGPDHRAADKYAADRRRDNMLQRSGYVVLRFTNEQVLDDVEVVVAEIESALSRRTPPPT